MRFGTYLPDKPENEPRKTYLPGSPEREELVKKLDELSSKIIEIPVIVGGEEYYTNDVVEVVMPHKKDVRIAEAHLAGEGLLHEAADVALSAKDAYMNLLTYERSAIFNKAAALISGPLRSTLNAATMLGLSKNIYEAEIDVALELTDLLRFNVYWMNQIYLEQPDSPEISFNRMEFRPLEGFVLAITPFNFSSIAGNLPSSPAIMGNTVVWKPASSALYSAYHIMRVFQQAGLPDGVINFVPSHGALVGKTLLSHPKLGGVHFTGSINTLHYLWKKLGENVETYRSFPRLVGESGGKDFVFAHISADKDSLITALIRGAFGYQGQKCSAASRAYIPESLWEKIKDEIIEQVSKIKFGDIKDFSNFMGAIINEQQFNKINEYLIFIKNDEDHVILYGGSSDDSEGFFIEPTLVRTYNPISKIMKEEIFGPVLTIYVYQDDEFGDTLELCDSTSPYGLTGSVFAKDRNAISKAEKVLGYSAGNFYINDKPTAAVVNQQPFGGSRKSGTNDKAGSKYNLLRWVSFRAIKENPDPPKNYKREFMK
ncbi:L-glutamate gamma-semialdehyde dehydrogenase [Candidatus Bathyarchaeota archaeon]|nr:L-glutamate gamma-semialdehyde dehydrogenase [Candidatus Bathyarchaeota archaeon]